MVKVESVPLPLRAVLLIIEKNYKLKKRLECLERPVGPPKRFLIISATLPKRHGAQRAWMSIVAE